MIKVISITYSNNNRKDRLTSLKIFTTVGRRQLRHLSFNHMDPFPFPFSNLSSKLVYTNKLHAAL